MKKKTLHLTKVAALCATVALGLSACGTGNHTDLMKGVEGKTIECKDTTAGENDVVLTDEQQQAAVADFNVKLFQNSLKEGENTLISPLSVLYALSMTANGAKGETLSQMEDVLGMPVGYLNTYLYNYMAQLPEEDTYKLSLANSIWFKDSESFTVNQDFLQINANYYDAGIFKAPFDDTTRKDINDWVEDNTDGMIKNILDEIPKEAVMYLVNALAFDAEWQTIYKENQVRDGVFTLEDGTTRDVEMMYSGERHYLEDDLATGFIKYYDDNAYAFVALLPKEGISVADYVASLDGEALHEMLTTPSSKTINAGIPKFETEYSVEMSDILTEMGMVAPFDHVIADFSGLGSSVEGNIAINRVLHKTFITVDEKGTKAGAATVVEMTKESAMEVEDPKTVILDRPFIYMLVDCENMMPFFMGTMMDVAAK